MTFMKKNLAGATALVGVAFSGQIATGAEMSKPPLFNPHAAYVGESASVIGGGLQRGTDYAGQGVLGVDIDSGAWTGAETPVLHVTATQRHGADASHKLVGNAISAQEVYGGGDTYRLAEFYVTQKFGGDLVSIAIGRMAGTPDFAQLPVYCGNFQSNSVCPGSPVYATNTNKTFFPGSSWAAKLRVNLAPEWFVQGAILDVDAKQSQPSHHGLDFTTNHSSGAVTPVELGYAPNQGQDPVPSLYKVGFFHDGSTYSDPSRDANGGYSILTGLPEKTERGRSGAYILFDQTVWRAAETPSKTVVVFAGAGQSLSGRTIQRGYGQLGILATGPFAARPDDTLGFAVTSEVFSHAAIQSMIVARAAKGVTLSPPKTETVLELNYGFRVNKALKITPNLQYIINPDSLSDPIRIKNTENAVIAGFMFSCDMTSIFHQR